MTIVALQAPVPSLSIRLAELCDSYTPHHKSSAQHIALRDAMDVLDYVENGGSYDTNLLKKQVQELGESDLVHCVRDRLRSVLMEASPELTSEQFGRFLEITI